MRANKVTLRDVQDAVADATSPEEAAALTRQARASQRQNVAMYDVTYSVDKSASTAHVSAELVGDVVLAGAFVSALVEQAEGLERYVSTELGASRIGYHGKTVGGQTSGRRVRTDKLAMAAHLHFTSREGDPQDHSHSTFLNRGIDANEDWHALDGQPVYNARPSMNAVSDRLYEMAITRDTGLRWEKDGKGGRRLAGVSQEVCDLFSKRRAVIEAELEQWAERFRQANGGEEPNEKDRVLASQRIAKRTRLTKTHVEREVALEHYSEEADARGLSLAEVYESLQAAIEQAALDAANGLHADDGHYDPEAVLTAALEAVSERQAHWNRHHLYAAIDKELPG